MFVRILTPFPRRGFRPRAVGTVRPPAGRWERPGGRPDPPNGSPGPPEQKESGHKRTQLPIRPSSADAALQAPSSDGACWRMLIRQTMEPVWRLRLP